MPDIRQTSSLHPFDGFVGTADTEPFPFGTRAPWFTSPGSSPVEITSSGLGGTEFPPTSSLGFYAGHSFGGAHCEMWGIAGGSPALTAGWRYGMYTVASVIQGAVDGYQVLPHNGIGSDSWTLRRYDNGSDTAIGSVSGVGLMSAGDFAMLRRNGNNLEVWRSIVSPPSTWELLFTVNDPTYIVGPFFAILGTTGTETGWSDLGAGVINRAHIYRVLKGLARR